MVSATSAILESQRNAKPAVFPGTATQTLWMLVRSRRALLLLGLVFLVVNRACGLVLPASVKFFVDDIIVKHKIHVLGLLVAVVLSAAVVSGVTAFFLMQLVSKEAQRVIADLRCKLQSHIGRLPVSFHDSTKTGALITRIMNDVEGIRNFMGAGLVEFLGSIVTAGIALCLMMSISITITSTIVACITGLLLILNRVFKILRSTFRSRNNLYSEITGRLAESLNGVRVVKGYRAEDREDQVFRGGVHRLLESIVRTLTSGAWANLCTTVMLGSLSALLMVMGARQIAAGHLSLGAFFSYVLFMGFLVMPVFQISSIGTQLTEALAGLERICEIMNLHREEDDSTRTIVLSSVSGLVTFRNVDFSYEKGKPVLHDVSFEAHPGTVTALVGPSGGGKSTILELVAAFHKVDAGSISIDGIDLNHLRLDSYRSIIGLVLQDSALFDGNIRENVAFSRPHATEEEVYRACRIAHVAEFAERFPDGYDTLIGERGTKISGGQRQRISIARAILADPKILILDEATSSLDSKSEAFIQDGLGSLMKGRTTFVVAHRLSTIRRAEQILVIENGRIVERGTHESLYAQQGRYYELYNAQWRHESNLFRVPGEEQVEPSETESDSLDTISQDGGFSALNLFLKTNN